MVRAYSAGLDAPVTGAAGEPLWLDGTTVTRIEFPLGEHDGADTLEAVCDSKAWPLLVDEKKRLATLEVTTEVRDAWNSLGRLRIACGANRVADLRCRPHRFDVGSEGAEFAATQRSSVPVPGSRDWAEVCLGDITRGQVRLEVRTVEGKTLLSQRSVKEGQAVAFRVGDEEYSIRVESLKNVLIGRDQATLLVRRGHAEDSPADGSEACQGTSAAADQEDTVSGDVPSLQATLIGLVRGRLAEAEEEMARTQSLLAEGKSVEARDALHATRERVKDAQEALRLIVNLGLRLRTHEACPEDLSIIRARITDARPKFPVEPDKALGLALLSALRLTRQFFRMDEFQAIDAEILEVHTVGKRYPTGTDSGRKFPSKKREDLFVGALLELNNWPFEEDTGQLEKGLEYWLAVTPPIVLKSIPGLFEVEGGSRIAFAMRVESVPHSPRGQSAVESQKP